MQKITGDKKMKYLILIGILLNLPFYVHSLSVLDMSYDDLSTAVALDPNNIDAKAELAHRYWYGKKGASQNKSKAIKLWEEAAEKGSLQAISKLGYIYRWGRYDGIENLTRAVQLYEQAVNIVLSNPKKAELEYYHTHSILQTLFLLHENGTYSSKLFLNNALTLRKILYNAQRDLFSHEPYYKKVVELYTKAEQGDAQALFKASSLPYEYKNKIQTRFELMKASEMGSVTAMLTLADIYINIALFNPKASGIYNKKHVLKTAINLLRKAFFQGKSAKAGDKLAHIYRYGIRHPASGEFLIKPNHLNSRTFLKESADLGSIDAMMDLEKIYDQGLLGVKPNKEKANQYYIQYSVRILENPEDLQLSVFDTDKIINRLREIARDGSPEANYQMGRFYRDGSSSIIPAHTVMASLFFQRALERGEHKEAETALREMIPKDILEANSFACPASFAKK